jgi:hypothetical protein
MSVQCYYCTPEALLALLQLLNCTQLIYNSLHVVLIHLLLIVQFLPWEQPTLYRKKMQAGSVGHNYPLELVPALPLDPPSHRQKMQGDSVDLDHSLG